MTKKVFYILIAAGLFVGAASAGELLLANHHHHEEDVLEHGGGLDQCGGHYNRKTGEYHYHRPPKC